MACATACATACAYSKVVRTTLVAMGAGRSVIESRLCSWERGDVTLVTAVLA